MFFNTKKQKQPEEQPTPLPVTPEELQAWMAKIISEYGLPDNDDSRDALCTQIMHLNQNVSEAPLSFFASVVKKSMANKAAYDQLAVYRDKRLQAQKAKEAEKAQPLETPPIDKAEKAYAI
jgi:hypothetical protein